MSGKASLKIFLVKGQKPKNGLHGVKRGWIPPPQTPPPPFPPARTGLTKNIKEEKMSPIMCHS